MMKVTENISPDSCKIIKRNHIDFNSRYLLQLSRACHMSFKKFSVSRDASRPPLESGERAPVGKTGTATRDGKQIQGPPPANGSALKRDRIRPDDKAAPKS